MSIINDALKKLQQKREYLPAGEGSSSPSPQAERKKVSFNLVLTVAAAVVVSIVVLVMIRDSSLEEFPAIKEITLENETFVVTEVGPTKEKPIFSFVKKEKNESFTLTGIFYREGVPIASINNVMVGLGETIDGAKVLEISEREVKLSYQDSEIILRLKR